MPANIIAPSEMHRPKMKLTLLMLLLLTTWTTTTEPYFMRPSVRTGWIKQHSENDGRKMRNEILTRNKKAQKVHTNVTHFMYRDCLCISAIYLSIQLTHSNRIDTDCDSLSDFPLHNFRAICSPFCCCCWCCCYCCCYCGVVVLTSYFLLLFL